MTDQDPNDKPSDKARLLEGTKVEVLNRFDGSWSKGVVIMEVTEVGYRLRRRYDQEVLEAEFSAEDVRRERKNSMWWM